ncbi:hypothetical protein Emed_006046 [Eimeria media]
MTRNPAIRHLALGVFAIINVALCWLWWQAVLVERHPLPDPCSFPDISNLLHAEPPDAANELAETAALSETSIDGLGSCVLSKSVQLQRQQWRLQLQKQLAGSSQQCPSQATSAPVEELLQWVTLLNIVPLCAEAESVAQTVYSRLAALGDAETPDTLTKGQCIVLPAASFLEATKGRKSIRSGSSNGLLAVRLSSNARASKACVSAPSSQEALAAFQEYDEALQGNDIEEIPSAHVRLTLFVSSPLENTQDVRLHVGAGTSMLLVAPRLSESATGAAARDVAAEAVTEALGRWVLSPAVTSVNEDAEWRVRLWLLGDGSNQQIDSGKGSPSRALQASPSAESADTSKPPVATRLHWDAASMLRTFMADFFGALSTLLDLSFVSQVVPHSGLQELEWKHVAPLLLSARGEEQLDDRTDSAFLEEFRRRVSNLSEEWNSDNEYRSSRSINLGLYKPTAAIGLPQNFALMLPFWGFLTFGAPANDSKHLKEAEGGVQQHFSVIRLKTEEEAALTAAWIAQLRSLLGLRPSGALSQGAAAPCAPGKQSLLCGSACQTRRCTWDLRTIESSASNTPRALASWTAPSSVKAADDFSLTPEKAILSSSSGGSVNEAFIFFYPSPKGLTDWEVGGLGADFLFSFATQAADNIRRLRDVLLNHHDIRIPDHIGRAMQHVMEQLQCSVDALRMRPCAFLPPAALGLLKQRMQPETCDVRGAGECAGPVSVSRRKESIAHATLALLLARSALKDSKELLMDGSLEPAPFFSMHFNLAIHVPLLLPFVLPTVTSLIKAAKTLKKKNV